MIQFFLLLVLSSPFAFAGAPKPAYYGREFYSSNATNEELKKQLFLILSTAHQTDSSGFDQIGAKCSPGPICYIHTAVGYTRARQFIFGEFYLVKDARGYGVKDVYCSRIAPSSEFPGAKPGPNIIPDPRVLNAEHTWPQSKFTRAFPEDLQKSDMHHLFPTDSLMNAKRGNFDFGNVAVDSEKLKCPESRIGHTKATGSTIFEVPNEHKGNVARALFYFSVRYKLAISPEQEATVREWNRLDPVDEEELRHNESVFALQFDRNPFVDFPELAERIADF